MVTELSQVRRGAFDPANYGKRSKNKNAKQLASARATAQRSKGHDDCEEDIVDSEFQIEVRFNGGLTASQKAAFKTAAARWSEIITGDLQSVQLPNGDVVDDLLIDASGVPIDGEGGILGQAGPTFIRANGLPAAGVMQFDTADLAQLEMNGGLVDVIIHEMGHCIGVGTLWSHFSLVTSQCSQSANPRFFGENAMREFGELMGAAPLPVPVANTGGPGTRCGHWRESILGHELMTGFLNSGPNPISRMTIGSLEDMGYEVNYDAADDYSLPSFRELMMLGVGDDLQNQRCCSCGGSKKQPDPVVLPEDMHL